MGGRRETQVKKTLFERGTGGRGDAATGGGRGGGQCRSECRAGPRKKKIKIVAENGYGDAWAAHGG